MFAVIKTGGKQYCVKTGQILKVEKIKGKKGDNLSFDHILAISDGKENTIGTPLVEGALIEAKILDQIRDKKIIVFKKRRRKNYRSKQGHRQNLTVLKIESILKDGKKNDSLSTTKKLKKINKNETVKNSISKKIKVKAEKKLIVKKTTPIKVDIKATNKPVVKKSTSKKTVTKKKMAKKQ